MGPLLRRWDGLRTLPRIPLVGRPTPVVPFGGGKVGAELWVKREDQSAEPYGGNKVRKLAYLLGDARHRGADALLTAGAYGSHHVLATSLYGREWGFEVHAVVAPQPVTEHVRENVRADLAAGAVLHPATSMAGVPVALAEALLALRRERRKVYRIGLGGSSPVGTVGSVELGVELAGQMDAGEAPEPDAVYVALGSGATAVGLAVGLAACGVRVPVVAVRVTDRWLMNRATLGPLARATVARLRRHDRRFPEVTRAAMKLLVIDGSELGEGYGHPTAAGEVALARGRTGGVPLDSTYTAKAFAAVLRDAKGARRGRRLLFVSTLNGRPMGPLLEGAPPAPRWLG